MWKAVLRNGNDYEISPLNNMLQRLLGSNHLSSMVYDMLTYKNNILEEKRQHWQLIFDIFFDVEIPMMELVASVI